VTSKSNRTLWLIAAVSVLPVVGSYLLYQWWRPSSHINHGELVETKPLPMALLADAATGKALPGPGLKGKWVLLTVQKADCDERCRLKLYYMRQVRTATNENMERIERVWVLDGPGMPDKQLLAEHSGLWLARTPDPGWTTQLPAAAGTSSYVYLIDPLGNIVLRYGEGFQPKGMLKDLGRLLKYSRIG
jgi:cytochrome oxidase Cu insertion factor (SCO1/SenC/PrrC family)